MVGKVGEMESADVEVYLPGYDTVDSFTQASMRAVSTAVKAANNLPECGEEFSYYDIFSSFHSLMLEQGKVILTTMSTIAKSQGINEKFKTSTSEEAFGLLLETNKVILENFDTALDEVNGKNPSVDVAPEGLIVSSMKTSLPINTSWNMTRSHSSSEKTYKLLSANNIVRPQSKFKEKVNNSNTAFVPFLKEKPNSIKPLAILLETSEGKEVFSHPYEWEIEKFQPRSEVLEPSEPILPKCLEKTPLMYIENEEDLMKMFEELRKEAEFAIDLEHHSYRSFQGFVCLMQISTRQKDYIIDTLKLRTELEILNEVFTDPKIVKVLHGADMDIVWLQRDFGLYIVNMFDTGQAARVLNFPHFSLAYLLKHYCKQDADKQFQLADWRIRPLFSEMIKYAREDTHYLLYIYDCLKNDLLQKGNKQKNLLLSVYDRSKYICLKRYEKPLFREDSYLGLYKKSRKAFNSRQLFALKELYLWRDECARENDESIGYVLPDHMLLQIAEVLPKEQQGLLACCNPVPQTVRQELNYLHSIVLKARDSSIPECLGTEHQSRIPEVSIDIDLDSILHCLHDIHHSEGFSGGVEHFPMETGFEDTLTVKQKPSLQIFNKRPNQEQHSLNKSDATTELYLSPYKRYNIVKELHCSQKSKEGENEKISDSNSIPVVCNPLKLLAAVSEMDISSTPKPKENPPCILAQGEAEIEKTTLRQKEKKKRKKKSHLTPDTSVSEDSVNCAVLSSQKKIRTQEQVHFEPFDYRIAGPKIIEELRKNKRKKQNVFEPASEPRDHQAPGKSWGKRKKHFRQATFSN